MQQTQVVPIASVAFDAGTQVRAAINEDVVADYAERMSDGVEFPPVVLFHDGNGYYMADGFHRGLARKRIGFLDVVAVVHPGTKTDALWYALGANRTNGAQMTPADKKHAILLALQAWPDKSQNQIADQIGCSQQHVQQVRAQVTTTCNLPPRVTGKDGKSYPATRPPRRPVPVEPSESKPMSTYEARKAAAIEDAPPNALRKLPRKADQVVMVNAINALQGIVAGLSRVDLDALADDPLAPQWHNALGEIVGFLRSIIRQLPQRGVA